MIDGDGYGGEGRELGTPLITEIVEKEERLVKLCMFMLCVYTRLRLI